MRTILHYIRIAVLWLLLFAVAKIYFFLVNDGEYSLSTFFDIWKNGLRLDFSMIGYLMIVPSVIQIIQARSKQTWTTVLKVYWWVVFIVMLLIVSVDPYFFSYWGQKTNLGFTQFFGKENAGFLSMETNTYVVVIAFFVLSIFWFAKWGAHTLVNKKRTSVVWNIILIAVSVVLLRGGIGKVPINLSSAYFSEDNLENNTAVNAVWNFLATEFERDKHAALVFFEDEKDLDDMRLPLVLDPNMDSLVQVNDSTNVVLLVLESFSAKVVGALSGPKYNATPNLNALMQEGINYHKAYASSFRSDKGLLGLTYSVPSGARQTLTNFPQNLAERSSVFSVFPEEYHTIFSYGGNLEFANIKVLFKDADEVNSQEDFESSNVNAWGVHDEDVFRDEMLNFMAETRPQFRMIFSLSSHEPFDVPNYKKLNSPYLNSISYTDSCLGLFVSGLKESGKWDNTLLIITADHGTIRPDNAPIYDTANFRIPLLLTGGAVQADTSVYTTVSQLDIFPTIAHLFDDNKWAAPNLLAPQARAFYSFHNGIVYVSDSTLNTYDIGMKSYIKPPQDKPYEKAFFQLKNKDFFDN